jgi:hypothetical protein
MNLNLLSVILMATVFIGAHHAAAEDEPSALAEQLYGLARVNETLAATMEAFDASFKESFDASIRRDSPNISDDDLEALHQIIDEESALAIEELQAPMKDLMIGFYTENFSAEELEALVEIQSSDVYQKQLDLMPSIMQRAADMNAGQMASIQERLSRRLRQWIEENR